VPGYRLRISPTTLELARAIASAVLGTARAGRPRRVDSAEDPPTQAVLRTLRLNGAWFCVAELDEDGIEIAATTRPLEREPSSAALSPAQRAGFTGRPVRRAVVVAHAKRPPGAGKRQRRAKVR
jgi:hypothetical protein